mgnify:CR=1 FL=1
MTFASGRTTLRLTPTSDQSIGRRQGPVLVQRRVSSQGGIQVAGQKLQVGHGHARRTVTVLVHDHHFEILDGSTPIKTIPRHTTKEVTRYKAYDSKPTNDQECQASTEL